MIRNVLGLIGQSNFNIGNTTKMLSNFDKKKGTLKKDDKVYSFIIGDDLKIKPMMPINDEIQDEETGMLKRADIKSMCDDLLAQICEEVYIIE